jgi:hypothetical protein
VGEAQPLAYIHVLLSLESIEQSIFSFQYGISQTLTLTLTLAHPFTLSPLSLSSLQLQGCHHLSGSRRRSLLVDGASPVLRHPSPSLSLRVAGTSSPSRRDITSSRAPSPSCHRILSPRVRCYRICPPLHSSPPEPPPSLSASLTLLTLSWCAGSTSPSTICSRRRELRITTLPPTWSP